MQPLARILFRMRFGSHRLRLRFVLSTSLERARLLSRVAELLWESRTGRRNNWFPDDPELTSKLRQIEDSQRQRPEDGDEGTELNQLHNSIALGDELLALLHAREALEQRRARWAMAVAAVVFVALVACLVIGGGSRR